MDGGLPHPVEFADSILLTELIFPNRRTEPWLKAGGMAVAGVCFALQVAVVGIAFRPPSRTFRASATHLAVTALAAAVLAVFALSWPAKASSTPSQSRTGILPLPGCWGW
jgi:hypothetical protein